MSHLNKFPSVLILFFGIFLVPAYGQNTLQKVYISDSSAVQSISAVAVPDGYVLAGTLVPNNGSVPSSPFLMKIGPDGAVIWKKCYTGNATELGHFAHVVRANDGGFLALGTSAAGLEVMILIKTDDNGNIEWQKTLHSYQTQRHNWGSVIIPVENGYILIGSSKKNVTHPVMTRIDNLGKTLWSKRYTSAEYAFAFQFYAGLISGDTIYACGARDTVAVFSAFSATTGNPLFTTAVDGPVPGNKSLNAMARTANGDFLLAGHSPFADASGTGSEFNQWLCRFNQSGELLWTKKYTESYNGKIIPLADDHFLLLTIDYNFVAKTRSRMSKIDGNGNVVWSYDYAKEQKSQLYSAFEAPDGGIFALGWVFNNDSLHSNLLVTKTDANGVIAGCCSTRANPLLLPAQAVYYPLGMNENVFDVTINSSSSEEDISVQQTDYCPTPTQTQIVLLCPGDSIVIDGVAYYHTALVTSQISGTDCDLLTYDIRELPNPTLEKTISFCAGDSVEINGISYTQPGIVDGILPSLSGGCDTLITYTLEYAVPSGSSTAIIQCPDNIAITAPFGSTSFPVHYVAPTVQSDCDCPGAQLLQTQGPSSGSAFPLGNSTVCFEAEDQCGNKPGCCFQVSVIQDDAQPCDIKVNGCLRFELLQITRDAQNRKTYQFRVQNNCSASLQYVAFQLPDGIVADDLQNNDTYTAPSGRNYTVRNPNNAPIHSIRFSAQGAGIQGGGSDVFEYTLPAQANPTFINSIVKLSGGASFETHLNTFNCPVEIGPSVSNRAAKPASPDHAIAVFPNPAEKELTVDLKNWGTSNTQVRVFNLQGQLMLLRDIEQRGPIVLQLELPAGLYLLEASTVDGFWRAATRFVVR